MGRILRSTFGHVLKADHLLGREELPHVRPALGALPGAYFYEAPPVFDDVEFVAVFQRR
jgi:hypothetical protein